MIVKNKFELVYDRSGDLANIVNLRNPTLSAYKISQNDLNYVSNMADMYGKSRNHSAFKIVSKHMKRCIVLDFSQYPLPGFTNVEKQPFLNVNILGKGLVSDYSSADVYALYLYTIANNLFSLKKPFKSTVDEHLSAFIFATFMKLFGKKAGLLGSYRDMIPKLRFIIWLYVSVSMGGEANTEILRRKLALQTDLPSLDEINLNYDFTSIKEFLRCINDNRIIPISENLFSSRIINLTGVSSLPIFEDISRFFATMIAVNVKGNSIFSTYWTKVRPDLYQKLLYIGMKNLNAIA